MSVGDRVPDRVSAVGSSDPAKIIGLLVFIYAVYLVAGSIAGINPVSNLTSLTRWIGLFAIAALALNLHWGYTGLFNIGVIGFMGVGVYVAAIVSKDPVAAGGGGAVGGATGGLGLPLPIGMLAGAVAAALFGLLVALPALRLRADYLAIVTIAVSEIFRLSVRNGNIASFDVGGLSVGFGGGDGLQLDWGSEVELLFDALLLGGVYDSLSATAERLIGSPVAVDRIGYALILLAFMIGYYALLRRIGNSPFGRVLKAIREDEEATNSLGKDTDRFKIIVFMIGCGLMGLVGVLWFMNAGGGGGSVNPTQFRPDTTFYIWVALIIGGAGSNTGSVMGGALFAAFLYRGPRFLQTVIDKLTETDLGSFARRTGFGEAMAPIAGSFDPIPLLLYAVTKIQSLQLLIMGLVIIYLMQNRPQGLLGHRKEQAAAISLSRPDRRSDGDRAVAADGGAEDE